MTKERDCQEYCSTVDVQTLAACAVRARTSHADTAHATPVDILVSAASRSRSALATLRVRAADTRAPTRLPVSAPTNDPHAPALSGRVDLEAPQIFERVGEVIFERVEEVLGEALRAHAGGRRVEGLEQVV